VKVQLRESARQQRRDLGDALMLGAAVGAVAYGAEAQGRATAAQRIAVPQSAPRPTYLPAPAPLPVGQPQTLCPNGSRVYGDKCYLAPNGTYVGGPPQLAPNGAYVGGPGKPILCPNGSICGRQFLRLDGGRNIYRSLTPTQHSTVVLRTQKSMVIRRSATLGSCLRGNTKVFALPF